MFCVSVSSLVLPCTHLSLSSLWSGHQFHSLHLFSLSAALTHQSPSTVFSLPEESCDKRLFLSPTFFNLTSTLLSEKDCVFTSEITDIQIHSKWVDIVAQMQRFCIVLDILSFTLRILQYVCCCCFNSSKCK